MMLALTNQQWTLILLAICVVPIAALIVLAIILRIKNSVRKKSNSNIESGVDEGQRLEFLDAFGGVDNFISAVLERIKVIVKVNDPDLIKGDKLQELGAKGVLIVGNEVRCSFGDRAEYVYNTLTNNNLLEEKQEEASGDETNE